MWTIEERVDRIPVSVVGATDGIDDASQLIEPFAELPGEHFPRFAHPSECRLRNHGSYHTIPAEHLGQGDGRRREQSAGDEPRKLHVAESVRFVNGQEHGDSRSFARGHPGRVSVGLETHGPS